MTITCYLRLSRVTPLLLGMIGAAPALAQTYIYAEVLAMARHTDVNVLDPFEDSDFVSREGGAPFGRISALADSDHSPVEYNGFGTSWSQVSVGGVHVYALAQSVAGPSGPSNATGSGRATGIVSDFFGLSVPGYANGAAFTVTAQVRVDGSAGAVTTPSWTGASQENRADAFSYWQSWIRVIQGANGPNLVELRAREDCNARTSFDTPPGCVSSGNAGTQTITFPMINNSGLVQLDMRGWASAGTSVNQSIGLASADSWSDLGHTVDWGGISELRDANNQPVTDFSAFSGTSGFDYRNAYAAAVPEAPSSLLLMAGFGLLGGWLRRRGARRAG